MDHNNCRKRKKFIENYIENSKDDKIIQNIIYCNCTDCGGKRQRGYCFVENKNMLTSSQKISSF